MKLKKAQMDAIVCVSTMMSAASLLDNFEADVIDRLPDSFEKTKAKLKELIATFNTEMEAASELYVEQEDEEGES